MLGESQTTVGGPANETRISFARTDGADEENPEKKFSTKTHWPYWMYALKLAENLCHSSRPVTYIRNSNGSDKTL